MCGILGSFAGLAFGASRLSLGRSFGSTSILPGCLLGLASILSSLVSSPVRLVAGVVGISEEQVLNLVPDTVAGVDNL
jgi:hypothetical protein